jgi:hypothetical protein
MRLYRILGGRPTIVDADVRVRNDRMWGADFFLNVWAYPGKGRNEGQPYFVMAGVDSGPRLLIQHRYISPEVLKQGFRTDHGLECLGCEFVFASVTPQTSSSHIQRLNQFNFACITRVETCRDPTDLAPALWNASVQDKASSVQSDEDDQEFCQLPTSVIAREANDILLVKVLATPPIEDTNSVEKWRMATVQVIETLKNGRDTPPGTVMEFTSFPAAVRSRDRGQSTLIQGQQYFFLYRHPRPDDLDNWNGLLPCHGVPNTAANAAEIKAGIALDSSAGEPYDYRNEPYTEELP